MIVKLLTEHHLEFLSLKGGCRGSSEPTHVKKPHCWKSHALAHFCFIWIMSCMPYNFIRTWPSWWLAFMSLFQHNVIDIVHHSSFFIFIFIVAMCMFQARKTARIRNRYNQVPHLSQEHYRIYGEWLMVVLVLLCYSCMWRCSCPLSSLYSVV